MRHLPPAAAAGALNVDGLPIVEAALWPALAAIDLDKGELKWQTPHGDTPDNVRNHPALKGHQHPEDRPAADLGRRPPGHQDARHHG